MGKYFGTDGIRGVAGKELSFNLVNKIGISAGIVLKKENQRPKVFIGKDTRISGDMIENALSAAFNSVGVDVIRLGVIPTPAVAYLVTKHGFDAGVVVSASHNPYEHNGIKFFGKTGFKFPDEKEEEIENLIDDENLSVSFSDGKNMGTVAFYPQGVDEYVEHICSCIDSDLRNLDIVVDCANGSASVCAEKIFKKLGCKAHIINAKPNGININDRCGSTYLSALSEEVIKRKAVAGVAFDGDADRCLCVDENGKVIDGDMMIALFAKELKEKGRLDNDMVAVTVMTNLGFFKFAEKNEITCEITAVGDRFVLERMLEKNIKIGGEQSGHIIFLDHATTGDGELSGVKLMEILRNSDMKMSELAKIMHRYPQVMVNITVSKEGKTLWEQDEEIKAEIEKSEKELEGDGRILVRPSGTEPLLRVMIEGKEFEKINQLANNIGNIIKEKYS